MDNQDQTVTPTFWKVQINGKELDLTISPNMSFHFAHEQASSDERSNGNYCSSSVDATWLVEHSQHLIF